MPDPVTPTTPAEGALPPTPEQPTPQPGQAPEQPQEQQVPVTREELDRRLAQLKSEVRQADKQRAQAIKTELNTMKQALEARGVQVNPQVEEALTQTIEQRLDAGQDEPSTEDDIPADDIPPEVQQSVAMMQKKGTIIKEADPEFKQFIQPVLDSGDLSDLSFATVQAIQAKQTRTLQNNAQAPLRTPAGGGEAPVGQTIDLNKPASYYLELAAKQEARNK